MFSSHYTGGWWYASVDMFMSMVIITIHYWSISYIGLSTCDCEFVWNVHYRRLYCFYVTKAKLKQESILLSRLCEKAGDELSLMFLSGMHHYQLVF